MLLAAYQGGASGTLWCNNTIIAEKRILRYFLATLLRLMYILSFYTINALRTQTNGRLLYVPFSWYAILRTSRASYTQQSHQFGTLSATKAILWLARVTFFYQCVHTFLLRLHTFAHFAPSTPFPRYTLYPPDGTKKRPTFRRGADIIADNINYFSTLFACSMYALFASFAALFASRFTFK